jgi:peptide deformylase
MSDKILRYPDPRLRHKAERMTKITLDDKRRAFDMLKLMREDDGIGLAAPQIGWPVQLVVCNLTGKPEDDLILVNPAIAEPSKETWIEEEGCLSVPGIRAKVERPQTCKVLAASLEGEILAFGVKGMLGRCLQHEIDHLMGMLFIDRLTPARKTAIRGKLKRLEASFVR